MRGSVDTKPHLNTNCLSLKCFISLCVKVLVSLLT